MNVSETNTENIALISWVWVEPVQQATESDFSATSIRRPKAPKFDLLQPIRNWLDSIEVQNPDFARSLCQRIPAQCPFERDVKLFGRVLFHIPPMCKLNPVYDQVVALRFRALCYLADVCGEDVTPYC